MEILMFDLPADAPAFVAASIPPPEDWSAGTITFTVFWASGERDA